MGFLFIILDTITYLCILKTMNHNLTLNSHELIEIAYLLEQQLQTAKSKNISKRISFYENTIKKIQKNIHGPVAQWLEQGTHNALVAGSNPAGSTKQFVASK
jgi:hypothetical protein